ncbi:UNVERIFIED_CONTAM: hypothetical protein FKN15_036863 [Acipenser sinensis]
MQQLLEGSQGVSFNNIEVGELVPDPDLEVDVQYCFCYFLQPKEKRLHETN